MTRTFITASDDSLMNLIQSARTRLAVIAPAITTPVAQALAARMADLPALSLTVILDADAEVYRMGYGDAEALEIRLALRRSSTSANMTFPTIESRSFTLANSSMTFLRSGPTFSIESRIRSMAAKEKAP